MNHRAIDKEVILETGRLFLRKMNMEDFDALYVILADSETGRSEIRITQPCIPTANIPMYLP